MNKSKIFLKSLFFLVTGIQNMSRDALCGSWLASLKAHRDEHRLQLSIQGISAQWINGS